MDHFFSRFGSPLEIFSDQGRNFESGLFTQLCKILQIHKARTTPYRPSANGQVERYNRTLMDAVRCFVGKYGTNWDLQLQQIAGALRSAVNRQTGFTPNRMVLGREVNTPAHLMFPHARDTHIDPDGYVEELVRTIQAAHEFARKALNTASKRSKRDYDLRTRLRGYKVGEAVYLLDSATLKGKCKKLSPPWKGPGVIVKCISAYLFRIRLRNAYVVVNHDRIKPCRDISLPAWIKNWKEELVEEGEEDDGKLYCTCRKPWQGRFMIQCDFCDGWFHGSCVDVSSTEATQIDKYCCPQC